MWFMIGDWTCNCSLKYKVTKINAKCGRFHLWFSLPRQMYTWCCVNVSVCLFVTRPNCVQTAMEHITPGSPTSPVFPYQKGLWISVGITGGRLVQEEHAKAGRVTVLNRMCLSYTTRRLNLFWHSCGKSWMLCWTWVSFEAVMFGIDYIFRFEFISVLRCLVLNSVEMSTVSLVITVEESRLILCA